MEASPTPPGGRDTETNLNSTSNATHPFNRRMSELEKVLLSGGDVSAAKEVLRTIGVDEKDEWGWTVLQTCIVRGQLKIALHVLEEGASVTSRTPGGATPLHLLCGTDGRNTSFVPLLEGLLRHGAEIDAVDSDQQTALLVAAKVGNLIAVQKLLEAGCAVNARASSGETALLRAVVQNNIPMCEALLNAGARDDVAHRKALQSTLQVRSLAPLMCPPSRLSAADPAGLFLNDVIQTPSSPELAARVIAASSSSSTSSSPPPTTPSSPKQQQNLSRAGSSRTAIQWMPDTTVLLPAPPDSDAVIVWGIADAPPARILARTEIYRLKMYERGHDVFFGENPETKILALACVSRWADSSFYLVIMFSLSIQQEFFPQHQVDQEGALPLLQSKWPEFIWRTSLMEASSIVVKAQVLGLEAKLSRRHLTIAVVFATANQWKEQDMFETPWNDSHAEVMQVLGDVIDMKDWDHFSGGFITGQSRRTYYTSFRGYEIVFHVAPMLSKDERRQFLGNDKVILYFCEEGMKPLVPRFRGEVNSVGIVLQRRADGWKMTVFHKERVQGFAPLFPGAVKSLQELKDYVLCVAINGYTSVLSSPPYSNMMAKVYQENLRSIISESGSSSSHGSSSSSPASSVTRSRSSSIKKK